MAIRRFIGRILLWFISSAEPDTDTPRPDTPESRAAFDELFAKTFPPGWARAFLTSQEGHPRAGARD
jgi:hypothetical protein